MLQDDDDAQVNRTDPTFSQSALSKVTARNIQIGQIMQTIVYLGLPLHSRHLCFGQLVANLGYLSCVIGGFIRLWQEGADLITYLLLIVGSGLLTLTCLYYVGFWKPEIEDKNSPSSDEAEKTQQKKHKTRQLTRRLALVGIFAIPLLTGGGYFFWKSLPPPGVRILVANFANSQYPDYRDDRQVTETILRNLRKATESYGEVEVQALSEAITEQQSSKVARARGESKKATIVIWGNYTASATDVQISTYFELLKSPTFFPELSQTDRGETQTAAIAQLDRFKLQTQLSNKMSYLTLFTLGMVQYSQKDWDKAIERFRDALDQVKTTPISDLSQSSVFFYRGTSYLSKSDYERAIVDYDKAIQLNPQNAFNYSNRGYAYYTEGEKDRAFADFDKAIQLGHQDAMAYFNRAAAYSDKGEKDRAIADYDKAIQLDPKLAKAYFNRGATYSDKGEKDRAIADYDKAIQLDPKLAKPYNNRGAAYSDKGEKDRAIADYDKAIQLDPKLVIAYLNRGNAYSAKGEIDRAIADYDKAIQLGHQDAMAYNNRGNAYSAKGEIDRAIADYDKAIQLDPKLAKPYYNRGAAYSDKGEKDRAFADFDKAIQIDPQDALAYTNRGYAYSAKGEIDRAIADYDKAIQLDPKLAIAYVDRGNAYKHKGDYNKALENFDRAISLDPKNAAAYGNRGLVYKDKGEKAEALKNFKKAFELFLSQGNTEGASQSSDDIKKLEGN